jgi:tetratricopeptide (TPR) repeat protein
MTSMAQLNATLAAISQRMQSGAAAESEALLNGILKQHPDHPGAHFMMGMIQVGREAWPDAERSFRHALSASPGQPAVCLNLGHALRAQHRPAEALDYCLIAAQASPDDIDAWAELAKAQEESGQPALAENSYRHILARGPNDWAIAHLAALMSRSGRAADAEVLVRGALAARPREIASRAALELQLGIALRAQRRYDEALEPLLRSRAQDASRDAAIEHANVLQHLARFEEAGRVYEELLARDPLDMEVHTSLNELSHRRGGGAPLTSYDLAQRRRPQAAILPVAKANMLLKLGRTAEACEAFNRALHIAPDDALALMGMGRALESLNDMEAARRVLENSVALHPENGDALESFAAFLLRRGDTAHAQHIAEKAYRLRTSSQGALALLGLCYRARDDARDSDLNRYESFVQVIDLDPPAGYADMESFNHDLAVYLDGLHVGGREYLTQTVRGGTQLHDEVFHNGHALIDRLLPGLNQSIRDYVTRLEAANDHPFVSRRSRGFCYAGSWSTRLDDCGFHVNHVHQKGWISSCYYVAVPDAVENEAAREGWIKFGEPSTDFGDGFPPRLAVQPRPGRLVLFPSYMWHGTVPFHSPQARTTIAFDLVPI